MIKLMQIVHTNPLVFCHELQQAVQDGWEIDDQQDFAMFYNLFTIGMKKEEISELEAEVFKPEAPKKLGRPTLDKNKESAIVKASSSSSSKQD